MLFFRAFGFYRRNLTSMTKTRPFEEHDFPNLSAFPGLSSRRIFTALLLKFFFLPGDHFSRLGGDFLGSASSFKSLTDLFWDVGVDLSQLGGDFTWLMVVTFPGMALIFSF